MSWEYEVRRTKTYPGSLVLREGVPGLVLTMPFNSTEHLNYSQN